MKRAFTLVELLVVIGIIGILIAVLLGTFSGSTESARAAKCQANMRNLAMAVQSYGMEKGYYPLAGSVDRWSGRGRNRTRRQAPGWIGWGSREASGSYISPYDAEADKRELSITNGAIWKAMNWSRDSYTCPSHIRACKDGSVSKMPLWSYVMSANFGWAYRSEPFSSNSSVPAPCKGYGSPGVYKTSPNSKSYSIDARTDRYLLFAELPFAAAKSAGGNEVQSGKILTTASQENDPILQYEGCDGGGNEAIGFNHKDGRNTIGHVCFADGHVEKLRMPKNFDSAQAKELTWMLCCPIENHGVGKPFDVMFDGQHYIKNNTRAE